MAHMGRYAKGVAKRDEILRTALEVFSVKGHQGTSLREIADAVGLSQAGLLHYFDSKEELYAEILRIRDESDVETYTDDRADGLISIMRHNAEVPGLVRLFATLSTAATEPDHPAHAFFVKRYSDVREDIIVSIRDRKQRGEFAPDLDEEMLATIMLALSDGMQVQWMFDPSRDMADHVDYLWSLLGRIAPAAPAEPTTPTA